MTEQEKAQLLGIKQRAIDMLNAHMPALVEIDINAPSIKTYMQSNLYHPDHLYDQVAFEEAVKKLVRETQHTKAPLNEKRAAEDIADSIHERLSNYSLNCAVPADEVGSVIKGDEFFDLTYQTRGIGEVFKECFFDMTKHPPDLLRIIDNTREDLNIDGFKNWAKYYGFSNDEANTLVARALKFRTRRFAERK